MHAIINLVLSAVAVIVTDYLLTGVHINDYGTAVVVVIVLGIVNLFIKPILSILALPINFITFGLFSLIINGVLILLVDSIVEGFEVDGFIWALLFSFVLSLVNTVLSLLKK